MNKDWTDRFFDLADKGYRAASWAFVALGCVLLVGPFALLGWVIEKLGRGIAGGVR